MKIAFRVDANSQIGTGHFMRCLTLARALLKQCSAQILFVSYGLPLHLCNMVVANEMEYVLLESSEETSSIGDLAHSHWLEVSQAQDAQKTIHALNGEAWDWLVVDHYSLDIRWESIVRHSVESILVIDDIADRSHDCDILLDQNFYTDMELRYRDKVPVGCQLLLGPRYSLLRAEFWQLHKQTKPRTGMVERVLVFFGGVDAKNYTEQVIVALSELEHINFHVDVVIGAQHPCREKIQGKCSEFKFYCHIQTERMAELMASADLSIGAGGTAIWERCCLGLPSFVFSTAANQKQQVADAAKECFLYAPSLKSDWLSGFKKHIRTLLENEDLMRFISKRAMQAIDGRGVCRVISNLNCKNIKMREVNTGDSQQLFNWRNHPNIRSVSKSKELIAWGDHQVWFASIQGSKSKFLLIGQNGSTPIGVVRFDIQKDIAEVSIYLVPDANNSGQGHYLLLSSEQWIMKNQPKVKHIRACVLGCNKSSQQLFLMSGYQVEEIYYLKYSN